MLDILGTTAYNLDTWVTKYLRFVHPLMES